MDAFFFSDVNNSQNARLFGVWRAPIGARRVWIVAPPFGEEEKSARRTLTDMARFWESRGEASLIFSYRGTGDSEGDFADFALSDWKNDIETALSEAQKRLPNAQIALLGVRLGASLALEIAPALVEKLILVEPLLSGRSFLSQQTLRKKLRADLTGDATQTAKIEGEIEDLDGWPLAPRLKNELNALNLRAAEFSDLPASIAVIQVGPKSEIAPPLAAFAEKIGAQTRVAVMPPFWNLLDYSDSTPILAALEPK